MLPPETPGAPPGAPPGQPPARPGTAQLTGAQLTTAEGRIDGYTTTPLGDMDGVTLDNGTKVHFPPHTGSALLPLLERGKTIRVEGWVVTGPQGTVIEASKVISTAKGQTVDVGAVPPPPAPAAPAPPSRPPGAAVADGAAGTTPVIVERDRPVYGSLWLANRASVFFDAPGPGRSSMS